MALYDADLYVDFLDAAERISTIRYRLVEQYDTTANTGNGNMDDVLSAAGDVITTLNVLTWDAIPSYRVQLNIAGGGTANISSNNQVTAFIRMTDDNGDPFGVEVPAWDDFTFDEDSQNLLSPAFVTAADALIAQIVNPDGNVDLVTTDWAQSRTRKSRNVLS